METRTSSETKIHEVWRKINPDWFNEIFQQQSEMGKKISDAIQPLLPDINFPSVELLTKVYEFREKSIGLDLGNQIENILLFIGLFRLVRIEDELVPGIVIDSISERTDKPLGLANEDNIFLKNGMLLYCFWGTEAKKFFGENKFWIMRPMYGLPKETKDYFCFYNRALDLFDAFLRANQWGDFFKLQFQVGELKSRYLPTK